MTDQPDAWLSWNECRVEFWKKPAGDGPELHMIRVPEDDRCQIRNDLYEYFGYEPDLPEMVVNRRHAVDIFKYLTSLGYQGKLA